MFPVKLNAREIVVLILMVDEGINIYDAIEKVYPSSRGEDIPKIIDSISKKLNDACV